MKYLIFVVFAITACSGTFLKEVLKEEWNSFKVRSFSQIVMEHDFVKKKINFGKYSIRETLCLSQRFSEIFTHICF